ncbi:unnamed protein product, partial [Staurois parvus]
NVSASYGANIKRLVCGHHVRILGRPLSCSLRQELTCSSVQRCSLPALASSRPVICDSQVPTAHAREVLCFVNGHLLYCPQSLFIPYTVRSLWLSLYCPQSLVIPCAVHSLWSSLYCLQSLVISCTVSAVSGHLLYCPQSLVISYTVRS